MSKAWMVGPYSEEYVFIVHAKTRSEARTKAFGGTLDLDEWTNIKAVRLPKMDDKHVTVENMLAAGFLEEYDGHPLEPSNYTELCNCELCKAAL